ncbi:MAG: radical SAM protein [Methanosarcinaceae archaeon]|nr:radical SAM protein [Methanosarcinaceae archaeon]
MEKDELYLLQNVGWELTYACNMRCKHCGSSCGKPKDNELTTEEALKLCDELADLKAGVVTLLGGEPLLRNDWQLIAKRLTDQGITVNMITNGWLLNEDTIEKAKQVGLSNIAVSIDGLRDTHDFIRMKHSFDRAMDALRLMKKGGIPSAVITTVTKKSLPELYAMKEIFLLEGVQRWQLQLAEPMGNLDDYKELIVEPGDIQGIVSFAYEVYQEGKIIIDVGDNIGYYDERIADMNLRSNDIPDYDGIWQGCLAGIAAMGITCQGYITGCLSLRDKKFVEDSIRKTPLRVIWTRPDAFSWNRQRNVEMLKGFCRECNYADTCFGGCCSLKISLTGDIADNTHCMYRHHFQSELAKLGSLSSASDIISYSRSLMDDEEFQLAERYLDKALAIDDNNVDAIDLMGFTKYSLGKLDECFYLNKKALELNPQNAYANKGMGDCLAAMGQTDEGIEYLKKAIELADDDFLEPYHDLAVVLYNCNKLDEALKMLDVGRLKSAEFKTKTEELYSLIIRQCP